MLFLIIVIVLVLLALFFIYNNLVRKRNQTQEAWSELDVELKRRHDLIPNLVETVKGYAAHESGTFEAVTQARANAVTAGATGDPAKIGAAENMLSQSLRSLFAVTENYPQLRAVESFLQLQESLQSTEDKIEFARRFYNTSARDYNIALQTFPAVVIANSLGFKPVNFFAADDADRSVPQVSFGSTPGAAADATAPPAANATAPPPPPGSGPPAAS